MFNSPLDKPMTNTQKIGWVLYIFIIIVSVWATGESLARSFKIPKLVAIFFGIIVSGSCAAFLSLIKNALTEKKLAKIIFPFLAFLLVWSISLLTNTHQFYLVGTLDKIRQAELENSKNGIENLPTSTLASLRTTKEDYFEKGNNLINNLYAQITDEENWGFSKKANKDLTNLQSFLGTPVTALKARNNSYPAALDLGQRQQKFCKTLLDKNIETIDFGINEVTEKFNTEEPTLIQLTSELNTTLDNLQGQSEDDIKNLLSKSYNFYDKMLDWLEEHQIEKLKDIWKPKRTLPEKVESAELEHIANSYKYVKENKRYNQPKFILAFLIAFAVDISAFIIFYFMALPSKKEW